MMRALLSLSILLGAAFSFAAPFTYAQELHNEDRGTYRAAVHEIIAQEMREIPGTEATHLYQTIRVEILEGPMEGKEVIIENDYLELSEGDRFYLSHTVLIDGSELYGVIGIDRTVALYWLVGLFVVVVIMFGGWQGVRSLLALAGSFAAIIYILMPGLLGGWPPLAVSFLVAAAVLSVAIFFTHGFNRESVVAFSGTMFAVLATGLFAIFAVSLTSLSGFAAEESVYLNFNTKGTLDFQGLLLGAIIIGVLGILDDIAVTQAAVVGELYAAKPTMGRFEAYKRAIRVGREHVSALVNTLVLAYTGASLPLLLLFYLSPADPSSTINMEIFATEIVRTIIGSIGLILTVPVVTGLASYFLHGHVRKEGKHLHTHAH